MRVSDCVACADFPCTGVRHASYLVPDVEVVPEDISVVLISESAPADPADHYYAPGDPLFLQMTVKAFRDAGVQVSSVRDILDLGVYLTTAVKCGNAGLGIKAGPIRECSFLLEKELALFPEIRAYLLMGNVAIKALNTIAQRTEGWRVLPVGSTYRIREQEFTYRGARVFPSYLQARLNPVFERSKRRMIAEDIAAALSIR